MKAQLVFKQNKNLILSILMIGLLLILTLAGCNKKDDDTPTTPAIPSGTTVANINNNPSGYVGSTVILTGYIVAQIDDDDFWFKDESQGEIRTDFPDGNKPTVGDKVKITGVVKYDDGKLEIDVSSWEGQSSTEPPNFHFDKISDIKANPNAYLYQPVALQGTITSQYGDDDDEFWFSDGSGEIVLDFPENGNMPSIGQNIVAVGNLTLDDNQLEVNVTYWE